MRRGETEAGIGYQDQVRHGMHEPCPQCHIDGSEVTRKQVEKLNGILMITDSPRGHLLCFLDLCHTEFCPHNNLKRKVLILSPFHR